MGYGRLRDRLVALRCVHGSCSACTTDAASERAFWWNKGAKYERRHEHRRAERSATPEDPS